MTELEFGVRFRKHMPLRSAGDAVACPCLVVSELEGPVRRADFAQVDWVAGRAPSSHQLQALSCFQSAVAVRLYGLVGGGERLWISDLCAASGYARQTVREYVRNLLDHHWIVQLTDGSLRRNWRMGVPPFRLSSYELKLADWRRACTQLTSHMLFADRAFLVMPEPRTSAIAQRIAEGIRDYPAGLVFLGDDAPRVHVCRDVPWTQPDQRLCALGKVCARSLGI